MHVFLSLARVGIGDLVASLHQPQPLPPDMPTSTAEGSERMAVTAPSAAPAAAAVDNNNTNNTNINNSINSGSTNINRPRTKAQIRADLAAISRLRRRVLFTPAVFRELAKEALLAEGRAFERYVVLYSVSI